jgi:hypothetical protein
LDGYAVKGGINMKELLDVLTVGNIHHVPNTEDSKLKNKGDKIQFSATWTAPCYCPTRCPWKGHGCYGEHGNCNMHFRNVAKRLTGTPINLLPSQVFSRGCGQYVRINVVGDMAIPGTSELSSAFVETIISAYPRTFIKELYTYTHCDLNSHNLKIMREAIARGFVINASCESHEQVKKAINNGVPAVLVVKYMTKNVIEKEGIKYVKCPNQINQKNKCLHCKKCMQGNRREVVVFTYHGKSKAPDFLKETV